MSTPLITPDISQPAVAYPYRKPLQIGILVVSLMACALIPAIIIMKTMEVDKDPNSKFLYHPTLMSIGVVGIPLGAILQQRLFGYKSKKIHMFCMLLSLKLVLAGAGVIFAVKISKKEPHFESAHSIVGLIWIVFATAQCIGGIVAMDPDTRLKPFQPEQGAENVNRFIKAKRMHAILGFTLLAIGYTAVFLGWKQIADENNLRLGVILGLLVLFAVSLVNPVMDALIRLKSNRDDEVEAIIDVTKSIEKKDEE